MHRVSCLAIITHLSLNAIKAEIPPAVQAAGGGRLEGVVQAGAGAGRLPRGRLLVAEVEREGVQAQKPDQAVQLAHAILQVCESYQLQEQCRNSLISRLEGPGFLWQKQKGKGCRRRNLRLHSSLARFCA